MKTPTTSIPTSQPLAALRGKLRKALGDLYHRTRLSIPKLFAQTRSALLKNTVGPYLLKRSIVHLHGPGHIAYGPDEALLICVVRNGALYLETFVKHHLALGVRHIVFLDNGSTDGTPELASRFERVTVLSTRLPYSRYENLMKTYLARRFSAGRWNLCCDVDELFEYPGSDRLPLTSFLRYLNRKRYSAVVTQMLDLVANQPLSQLKGLPGDRIVETYDRYDLTNIRKLAYDYSTLSSDQVKMHMGGIRYTLFGTSNGLTKAALVLVKDEIELFHGWHQTRNAVVADVTCVLRHYPFTGTFFDKVKEAAESSRYGYLTTHEYQSYWSVLANNPDLNLCPSNAERYSGTDSLLKAGFLVASSDYLDWVKSASDLAPPDAANEKSQDGSSPESAQSPHRCGAVQPNTV